MRVLYLDIENAPISAWVWTQWVDGRIIDTISEWYMLCWAAKWRDGKKVMSDAIWHHPAYKKDRENDKPITLSLNNLINEADVVIAHNGDRFDLRKIRAKCVEHGIDPPSPYYSVDTLKIARGLFAFSSNKLDFLGRVLGVGRKIRTGGFDLWKDVMSGDEKAQDKMLRYCRQDVQLLEAVHRKLEGWSSGASLSEDGCPKCGGDNLIRDGYYYNKLRTTKYQQFRCKDCGGWSRGRNNLMEKDEANHRLVGV